jgi:hypothetical protein
MQRNWSAAFECLLIGHDDYLCRATGRLYLRCERCGRETRGWVVGKTPPTEAAASSEPSNRWGEALDDFVAAVRHAVSVLQGGTRRYH